MVYRSTSPRVIPDENTSRTEIKPLGLVLLPSTNCYQSMKSAVCCDFEWVCENHPGRPSRGQDRTVASAAPACRVLPAISQSNACVRECRPTSCPLSTARRAQSTNRPFLIIEPSTQQHATLVSRRTPMPRVRNQLDNHVFAEIERELGLPGPNAVLRSRINLAISLYFLDRQRITAPSAEVSNRLKAVNAAARNLYQKLNESPVEVAARAAMESAFDRLLKGRKMFVSSKFFGAMRKKAAKLPNSRYKTACLKLFGEQGGEVSMSSRMY